MPEQIGPYRPHEVDQGPAESCVIGGRSLGWLNCTCAACAVLIDGVTLGGYRPDDCTIRRHTGDLTGGTRLDQVAYVARHIYGVIIEQRTGRNVAAPSYLAGQLRLGRRVIGQGGTKALLNTPYKSTATHVNHAITLNEGRGWRKVGAIWVPALVLAYDSAADARKRAWGTADDAPTWWPWQTFLNFCAALEPSGEGTGAIGPGKIYAGLGPLPRVRLRYTGSYKRGAPHPLAVHPPVAGKRINIRSGPSVAYPTVRTLGGGDTFVAYQRNPQGQSLLGSRLWEGSEDGSLWAHISGLR